MNIVFFVSVGKNETEKALKYTFFSLSRFGDVVFHVDDVENEKWVKSVLGDVETVVVKGLGRGRGYAFKWFLDHGGDVIVISDSHVVLLEGFECGGFCDFKRFDFGFDVEDNPLGVVDRVAWHFGQVNWDRVMDRFVFDCKYKPYSYNPLTAYSRHVVKRIVDVYSKYGLDPIPWPGYGADVEQLYVSAFRLFGIGGEFGKCVYGREGRPVYGHRASVSNINHPFWSNRWKDQWYYSEWYQANVCFLKLQLPQEYWDRPRSRGFDPNACKYIDDNTVKKINEEFKFGYEDFIKWLLSI